MFFKLIGLFALLSAVCSAQKVKVNVYYEALCPDSQAFITEQLFPALQNQRLEEKVDLKLVPFGKANFTTMGSDVQFTCHHGPNECYGNKIQSCAIEHIQVDSFQNNYTRQTLSLAYINCLMRMGNNFADSMYPGKKCAEQIQLNNWAIIEQCANTTEGSKLLQRNGELTYALKPELTSVPTVTFKEHFDRETQNLAMSNFRVALCKTFSSPLPAECSNIPNSAERNVVASVLIAVLTFAIAQLF